MSVCLKWEYHDIYKSEFVVTIWSKIPNDETLTNQTPKVTSPHHDLSHIETNNIITFAKNGHGSFKLSGEGPPQFQKVQKKH